MADNVATIVDFFRNKGLPDKVIAGILGNIQTESGFDPSNPNAAEGAIGLAQWEGGRRTALQDYARAHGTTETDLKTQLNFMWDHELSSAPYNTVLSEMNAAPSAGAAAAIWDQKYEVSSGSTRSQRMAQAESFASSGLSSAGVNVGSSGGGGMTMDSATSSPALTPDQKKAALQKGAGPLYQLAVSVPELAGLINTAISTGQSTQEFMNAVTNSKWYRTHADTVRDSVTLEASDPATFQKNLNNQITQIQNLAHQMGVTLQGPVAGGLARQAMYGGWDQQTLSNEIGKLWQSNNRLGVQHGQAANVQAQVKQIASDYGLPATEYGLQYWTNKILTGQDTLDGNKAAALAQAKTMYAPFAQQLDAGQTMRQIADPYIAAKANLLEVDPATINFSQDPMIKRALQGTSADGGKTPPTAAPLWQFEQTVRSDPGWQFTKNAHQDTSQMLLKLGQDWGFAA